MYNLFLFFILYVNFSCEVKDFQTLIREISRDYQVPEIDYKMMHLKKNAFILDCRTIDEFNVSHIPQAIHVKNFSDLNNLENKINLHDTIIVYCSVGVRSSKLVKELQSKGFNNVYNLKGGIFMWINQSQSLHDNKNNLSTYIHGYNHNWSSYIMNTNYQIVY